MQNMNSIIITDYGVSPGKIGGRMVVRGPAAGRRTQSTGRILRDAACPLLLTQRGVEGCQL
jgi:hypothetical protein